VSVPASALYEPTPRAQAQALALVAGAVLMTTSVWFTATAVTSALALVWQLSERGIALLTVVVQLGFIAGTSLFAVFNLADVFNPRRVFFVCAVLAGLLNLGFAYAPLGFEAVLMLRLLTGMCLAGVYPVSMKIVASWYQDGLGWRLGILLGALTLGTAAPYAVRGVGAELPWRAVVGVSSASAIAGGLLVRLALRDGPFLRPAARFALSMVGKVFTHRPFRLTALGYFGHMWELYAFWSLMSLWIGARGEGLSEQTSALIVFSSIALGALGCVVGGFWSRKIGERRVALVALLASATLCAGSGFAFQWPLAALVVYLGVWGVCVVADSPQFSALAARHAPREYVGTALTIQNGLGFTVTVVAIQVLPELSRFVGWRWAFVGLTVGPALGAWATWRLGDEERIALTEITSDV